MTQLPLQTRIEKLSKLEGTFVRVAIVPDALTRNHFGPQIAVAGTLEIKTDDEGQPHYRVLSDKDNFSYFGADNVVIINTLATAPTITLSIPVDEECLA